MSRQGMRFYCVLAACFLGFGTLGGLAVWALSGHPEMVPETLALLILLGLLARVERQRLQPTATPLALRPGQRCCACVVRR